MYNQDVYLVYVSPTDSLKPVNDNGFPVNTETAIAVGADIDSVGGAEVYAALRNDIELTFLLRMRKEDWDLSKHTVDGIPEYATNVRLDGVLYKVIKTYTKASVTEVTCGKV